MSLTRLLKQMQKLDNRASEMQLRYSTSLNHQVQPGFADLESAEDKKIYGTIDLIQGIARADLLQSFKERTRFMSKSKVRDNRSTAQGQDDLKLNEKKHRRGSSAMNPSSTNANGFHQSKLRRSSFKKKQKTQLLNLQFHQLFKNDIFLAATNCSPPAESYSLLSKMRAPVVRGKDSEMSRKLEQRKFMRTFKECLSRVEELKDRKKQLWKGKTKVIYDENKPPQKQQAKKFREIRKSQSTREMQRTETAKMQVFLTGTQLQVKKDIYMFSLPHPVYTLHCMHALLSEEPLYTCVSHMQSSPFMCTTFPSSFPPLLTIYLIDTANLSISRLILMKMPNGEWREKEKDKTIKIAEIRAQALSKVTEYLHVCVLEGEGLDQGPNDGLKHFNYSNKLIYEQFWSANAMSHAQRRQNQIFLIGYYLKRFLLFDRSISEPKPINHSVSLILNHDLELPNEFLGFLPTFPQKMISFISRCEKAFTLSIRDVLLAGISQMRSWKQQMGVGHKALVLKTGVKQQPQKGKDKSNKVIYNWEYFYICLFLSWIQLWISILLD